jgi:hypothetical protein
MKVTRLSVLSNGDTLLIKINDSKRMEYCQNFLTSITGLKEDFSSFDGCTRLITWVKHQPWHKDFFGVEKIPSKFLHPEYLADELTKYLS